MFNINQLLNKVRAIRNSDIGLRSAVQTALRVRVGLDIPIEYIRVKPPKVFLKNISSSAKNEVFIKKAQILEDIKLALNNDCIKEIG